MSEPHVTLDPAELTPVQEKLRIPLEDDAVIGAGSVVTKSIPPGVFAAGNPCRVMRTIEDLTSASWSRVCSIT